MSSTHDQAIEALDVKLTALLTSVVTGIEQSYKSPTLLSMTKEGPNQTSTSFDNGDENFDGWLSININNPRAFSFDLQQLKEIRDNVRALCSNDIYHNIIKHYQNHMVGDGLVYEITKKDTGADPKDVAKEDVDPLVETMITNWEEFEVANDFNNRLLNIVERAMRDGESPLRVFDTEDGVKLRFLECSLINPTGMTQADLSDNKAYSFYAQQYGVRTKKDDIETILGYYLNGASDTDQQAKSEFIKAESVLFIKRNTDYEFPRGLPDFWPILKNIRRVEKITQNTSVLIQIQSAIALIRKHKGGTQPKVARFVAGTSDGINRVDNTTGRAVTARKFRQGMILDTNENIDYELPSVGVKPEGFIAGATQDLTKIASRFVLPISWLLAAEPTEPLSPGSPTVQNFRTQQAWLYAYVEKLFWLVQEKKKIDVKSARLLYELTIEGPLLAVGKLIDQARVVQILQQCAAISPQSISRMFGRKYNVERANTIRHRKSLQPGEVAPGDLGNTEPGKNNGTDAKGKGTKADNATGGDTVH